MLAEKRKRIAEKECTRDPIFLLQIARIYIPQASFDNELYVENDYFDEGGVFLTPASHNDYLEADFSDEDQAEAFWRECDTLTDEELISHELAVKHWDTETVWLTREEAEQHAERRPHYFGKKGEGWQVYCVCAEGELARALVGGVAKGTNYLPNTKGGAFKWRLSVRLLSRQVKNIKERFQLKKN